MACAMRLTRDFPMSIEVKFSLAYQEPAGMKRISIPGNGYKDIWAGLIPKI